jgi:hypothetical protein
MSEQVKYYADQDLKQLQTIKELQAALESQYDE